MVYRKTYFDSWSYSRYSTYRQCPLKAKLSYLDKLDTGQPKSIHLVRGDDIHKQIQAFLQGETPRVPKIVAPIAEFLKGVRKRIKAAPTNALIEETIALTQTWNGTVWNDWKGCWVRIKMDLAIFDPIGGDGFPTVEINDWKSGKFRSDNRDDYMEQLELYGLGSLIRWGKIKDIRIKPKLVYTDHNKLYPESADAIVYTLDDLPKLKKSWEKKVKPMMNDRTFVAKPNQFCGTCDFGVSKGGPCRFG